MEIQETEKLKRYLIIRYAIGLSLIAIVICTSYLVLQNQVLRNEKDAYIINISGMQRMLSQRIALFSREIFHAQDNTEAQIFVTKLNAAVEKMMDNHEQLSTGVLNMKGSYTLSETILGMYFNDDGIDEQVRHYIELANLLIADFDRGGLPAVRQSPEMDQITAIARNGFLDELNKIVFQYERESDEKIDEFQRLETYILCIGLLILILEALFIFHPMIRLVTRNHDELSRANKELTEFSYRISHDLRAPIVSSLGLINVTEQSMNNGQTDIAKTAIDHIRNSLVKLENLIEDVITMTRMKMTDIPYQSITLNDEINDSLAALSHLENYDIITIEKEINVQNKISVKELYLRQILENLISNAIKYYNPDEQKSFIRISANKKNNMITLKIRDNGIGIPEDQRDKLFSMFQRFHPQISFGSGLGLYLVKQNVDALDGNMQCIHHINGTEFIIKFPIESESR